MDKFIDMVATSTFWKSKVERLSVRSRLAACRTAFETFTVNLSDCLARKATFLLPVELMKIIFSFGPLWRRI